MRLTFIDPGSLRTELRLEKATQTSDELGGKSEVWSEVAVLFAMLEPLLATQVFRADQDMENATHRIIVRMHSDLKSGMRFKNGSRTFRIAATLDPDETGRYLNCYCEELL